MTDIPHPAPEEAPSVPELPQALCRLRCHPDGGYVSTEGAGAAVFTLDQMQAHARAAVRSLALELAEARREATCATNSLQSFAEILERAWNLFPDAADPDGSDDLAEHIEVLISERDALRSELEGLKPKLAKAHDTLKLLRNHSSVNAHQIMMVDEAMVYEAKRSTPTAAAGDDQHE